MTVTTVFKICFWVAASTEIVKFWRDSCKNLIRMSKLTKVRFHYVLAATRSQIDYTVLTEKVRDRPTFSACTQLRQRSGKIQILFLLRLAEDATDSVFEFVLQIKKKKSLRQISETRSLFNKLWLLISSRNFVRTMLLDSKVRGWKEVCKPTHFD